jgi:hypothetical protein
MCYDVQLCPAKALGFKSFSVSGGAIADNHKPQELYAPTGIAT